MTTTTTTSSSAAAPSRRFPFAGLFYVNPKVTVYTGSKKLTPEDLGLKPEDLPEDILATLGNLHTISPSSVQKFESGRNALAAACLKRGTRGLGGYLYPKAAIDELFAEANEVIAGIYEYRDEFIKVLPVEREKWMKIVALGCLCAAVRLSPNFALPPNEEVELNAIVKRLTQEARTAAVVPELPPECDKWIKHPAFTDFVERIRGRTHTVDYIRSRIQAKIEICPLGDMLELGGDEDNPSPLAAGAYAAANIVGYCALEEVAQQAKALMRDSLHDKAGMPRMDVTQRILSPIRAIRDKLFGLSFADPRLGDVVNHINHTMGLLPKQGKMEGKDLQLIFGLVLALSDPDTILQTAVMAQTTMELDSAAQQELIDIQQDAASSAAPAVVVDTTPVVDDVASDAPKQTVVAASSGAPVAGELVYDEC